MTRIPTATAVSFTASTLRIRLSARPNSPISRVIAVTPDRVLIAVSAPARQGEANRGIISFVCKVLGFRKGDAKIVAGWRGGDKVLTVEGVVGGGAGEGEKEVVVEGVLEKLRSACRGKDS